MILLDTLDLLDLWLLLGVKICLEFCLDWLSWTQASIERALIVAYGFVTMASYVVNHLSSWMLLCIAWMILLLVARHRIPDAERLRRLNDEPSCRVRMVIAAFFAVMCGLCLLPPRTLLSAGQYALLIVEMYVTALPREPKPPGRKRKALAKKIAERFVPEPLPEAA